MYCTFQTSKKLQLTRSPRREFPSCWTIYDLNRLGSWLRKSIRISVLHSSITAVRGLNKMWLTNIDGTINTIFNKYPAETIFLSWLCNTSEIISKTPSPERSLKKNRWLAPGVLLRIPAIKRVHSYLKVEHHICLRICKVHWVGCMHSISHIKHDYSRL